MASTPTIQDLLSAQDLALERLFDLVSRLDPALPVEGTEWDVRQVVAHLVGTARRYESFAAENMATTPRAVDELNQHDIGEFADRSLAGLRHDLVDAHHRLQTAARERTDGAKLPFHAGLMITPAGAAGEWLGELLIHGYDIACTAKQPWPIRSSDALAVADFAFEVLPGYFDGGALTGPLQAKVHVRGRAPKLLSYEEGRLTITTPSRRSVDLRLWATPQAWILLGYGRVSLVAAIRRGLIVTGGRRPWRALELLRATVAP